MEDHEHDQEACSPSCRGSKKLISNVVRLIMFTIQKGLVLSKSTRKKKLNMIKMMMIPDRLQEMIMQRGKLLGKSFNDLMIRHNTALGCSSHDVRMSFVSPRDYEFSCSSTPPVFLHHHRRRRSHRRCNGPHYNYYEQYRHGGGRQGNRVIPQPPLEEYYVVNGKVKKNTTIDRSPFSSFRSASSTGYITHEEEGVEEEFHVDKAAEEFIERFYRELMLQKLVAAREAPPLGYRFG